ncbi:hydroxymethylglutaryl-CoA lyase [Zobellella maritima]|uniref:hydroxymethylglutaryl-CoA lyase n=1 Tax=Zobellella maritima TaxID=2059725 RepID=UPI000E30A714|nr:hydroxymethylglutaryl-CoA lyase [Zobellella maritima]
MSLPERVRLVEVSPRDGLQNEPGPVIATDIKVELIDRLSHCGVRHIEAASFVSPRWVPQMADGAAVLAGIERVPGVVYAALTPNLKGLAAAAEAGADEVAVFGAASDTFTRKNINCSIAESLARFAPLVEQARAQGLRVRGYVSTVLGCPFEGEIAPSKVALVARELYQMGCYEISLGDTIGVGTPLKAKRMLAAVQREVPVEHLAAHFHDSYGQALANLYAVLEEGVAVIDASVAGLGGCPYARGASGNVASEDVLYLLQGLGIETGIDLTRLIETGWWISRKLGRENGSKTGKALCRSR